MTVFVGKPSDNMQALLCEILGLCIIFLQGCLSGPGFPRAVEDSRRRPLHRHDRGFLRRDRGRIRGDALAHAGGQVPQAVHLPVQVKF